MPFFHQLSEFIVNHWQLSLAAIVVLMLILFEESRTNGVGAVAAPLLVKLMNSQKVLIVDVREATDFQLGHILSAINIPKAKLADQITKLTAEKNKTIILVSSKGTGLTPSMALLRKQGVQDVKVLKGGLDAWKEADLPMLKEGNKQKKESKHVS